MVTPAYMYKFNVAGWGWIHLLVGLALAAGVAILSGAIWARGVGIGIAVISAIAQFLSLPYYPVWAILVIALDVGVIWALTVHDPHVTK